MDNGRYYIAPEVTEREKIIGGVLDAVQITWIAVFIILGIVVGVGLYYIISWFAIPFGVAVASIGFVFAFYKHRDNNLNLFTVIKRNLSYIKKTKVLLNRTDKE